MQQDSEDSSKLEALLENIQKDVKALKAGDHAARTRLVDSSAQLQRAIETPAERTFKMRFAAGFSMEFYFESYFAFSPRISIADKELLLIFYPPVPPTIRNPHPD